MNGNDDWEVQKRACIKKGQWKKTVDACPASQGGRLKFERRKEEEYFREGGPTSYGLYGKFVGGPGTGLCGSKVDH